MAKGVQALVARDPWLKSQVAGRLLHAAQKVHSNEQIRASGASGGRPLSQHSQLGLSVSILAIES